MARKVKPRKFKIDSSVELNEKIILKLIERHKEEKTRCEKMLDYYDGRNDILDREYKKKNRPTNRVPHPIASYLCNMLVGYTLGKEIVYKSEDEELLKAVNDILSYNDIADLDQALADMASACGYAYELHYMDQEAMPRLVNVSTEEMLVLFDNTVEENILYGIRYWEEEDLLQDNGETTLYVEVYSKDCIKYYKGTKDSIKYDSEAQHEYKDVPIVVFPLNNKWTGCYEKVKCLIDKYDQVESDIANIMESNASKAILVIAGATIEEEEGEQSLEADVINFENPESKASFLTKNIDTSAVESFLDRLMNDIHTLSQIPPLDSEGFVSSASGESLKWKTLGLEILASTLEAKFRKAIARRMELLCNILSVKHNREYDFNLIESVFTRNTPANATELSNIVRSLYGIVSTKTLLGLLPFIKDPELEMELLKMEKEESAKDEDYDFDNMNKDEEVDEEEIKEDEDGSTEV